MHPDDFTVAPEVALLHLVGIALALDAFEQIVEIRFQVVGMRDVLKRQLDEFILGILQHVAQGVVHLQPAAIQTDKRNAVRRTFQRQAETQITLRAERAGRAVLEDAANHRIAACGAEDADGKRIASHRESCHGGVTLGAAIKPCPKRRHHREDVFVSDVETARDISLVEAR